MERLDQCENNWCRLTNLRKLELNFLEKSGWRWIGVNADWKQWCIQMGRWKAGNDSM